MHIKDLPLDGLKLITPMIFHDERGFFFESFSNRNYSQKGIAHTFVQDNVALSKKGTIRALHYQAKPGQAKLVSCSFGKIWDIAVDIRPDSQTFGYWIAQELDDQSHQQLYIPVGFAHGYCVLSEIALVHYKVSSVYDPKQECSIRWNDPDIGIQWPIENPILSERDQKSPFFKEIVF